jgi:hypothetical protein
VTEDQLEQEVLGWLADVGYTPLDGPDLAPDGSRPERGHYREVVLDGYRKKIDKTVDLFSRIKNTDQAEEVATVLYAVRKLKQEAVQEVSEEDLYRYILGWKKSWDREDKRRSIAGTIRNLEMLNWMRLKYSEALEVE